MFRELICVSTIGQHGGIYYISPNPSVKQLGLSINLALIYSLELLFPEDAQLAPHLLDFAETPKIGKRKAQMVEIFQLENTSISLVNQLKRRL